MPKKTRKKKTMGQRVKKRLHLCYHLAKKPMSDRYHRCYHPRRPHARKHFWVDLSLLVVLFFLVLFSGVSFYLYLDKEWEEDVVLDYKIFPENLENATEATLIVNYENNTNTYLKDVVIQVRVPKQFRFKKAFPLHFELLSHSLSIPVIPPRHQDRFMVRYDVLGDIGDLATIDAVMTYSGAREKEDPFYLFKDKQERVVRSFKISQSALALRTSMPAILLSDREYHFAVGLENRSESVISRDLETCFVFDEFMSLIESVPALDGDHCVIFDGLHSLEVEKIFLNVKTSRKGEGVLEIFSYAIQEEERFLIAEKAQTFELVSDFVKSVYTIDGDSSLSVLEPERFYEFEVVYFLNEHLGEGVFLLPLDASVFDLGSVEIPEGGELVEGRIVGAHRFLPAVYSFSFKAKINSFETLSKTTKPRMNLDFNPQLVLEDKTVMIEPVSYKISSPLQALFDTRYYALTGDQIGRGPIPPQAGQTTSYWVFMELFPGLNDFTRTSVSMRLPSNVFPTEKKFLGGKGEFGFREDSRTLVYYLDELESVFKDSGSVRSGFELKILPSSSQVGQIAPLLTDIKINTVDNFTKKQLGKSYPIITTELKNDEFAQNKGVIQ